MLSYLNCTSKLLSAVSHLENDSIPPEILLVSPNFTKQINAVISPVSLETVKLSVIQMPIKYQVDKLRYPCHDNDLPPPLLFLIDPHGSIQTPFFSAYAIYFLLYPIFNFT